MAAPSKHLGCDSERLQHRSSRHDTHAAQDERKGDDHEDRLGGDAIDHGAIARTAELRDEDRPRDRQSIADHEEKHGERRSHRHHRDRHSPEPTEPESVDELIERLQRDRDDDRRSKPQERPQERTFRELPRPLLERVRLCVHRVPTSVLGSRHGRRPETPPAHHSVIDTVFVSV